MSAPFRFDRSWNFDTPQDQLWQAFSRTDLYPTWWTWLRSFEAPGLYEGARAHCVIRSPLPYSLHLTIDVERVVVGTLVETIVSGDLSGPARLEIEQAGSGSRARLSWQLDIRDGFLRTVAGFGRPLAVWAHDAVVALGVEQFRRRGL